MNSHASWISGVVQQVVAGLILAALVLAAGTVGVLLAKATTSLQQYEPLSYYLAGLTAALLAGLVLLIGISIWRKYRPTTSHLDGLSPAIMAPYDDAPLRSEIAGVETRVVGALDGLKGQLRTDRDTDRANIAALNDRLAEVEAGSRDYAKTILDALLVRIATEAGERVGMGENLTKQIERLGQLHNEGRDFARAQIVSLYNALHAVQHQGRLEKLTEEIEEKAGALRTPTTNNAELDESAWESWLVEHEAWRALFSEWCGIADCYAAGIGKKVGQVTEADLQKTGVAKSAQFPSPEAFIIYKGFNIRYMKWREWRDEAHNQALRIALNGTAESRTI